MENQILTLVKNEVEETSVKGKVGYQEFCEKLALPDSEILYVYEVYWEDRDRESYVTKLTPLGKQYISSYDPGTPSLIIYDKPTEIDGDGARTWGEGSCFGVDGQTEPVYEGETSGPIRWGFKTELPATVFEALLRKSLTIAWL